jgi:HEAT repeat protein
VTKNVIALGASLLILTGLAGPAYTQTGTALPPQGVDTIGHMATKRGTMAGIWASDPKLEQRLLGWEREAGSALQSELERLREDTSATRAKAAAAVALMGADGKGAIIALVDCWSWAPARPSNDRLALTRWAADISLMRSAADRALAAIGAPAVEPLVFLSRLDDESIRKRVGPVLSNVRDPAAVDYLIPVLEWAAPAIQEAAATALGRIGDPRATDALGRALEGGEQQLSRSAAVALREIGGEAGLTALMNGLRSANPDVRKAAGELARVSDPLMAPVLLEALEDDHDAVVIHAAEALGGLKDDRALDALASLLPTRSAAVHTAALAALDQIRPSWRQTRPGQDVIPQLVSGLRSPRAEQRARIALTLGQLGGEQVLAPLIEILKDPEPLVRDAAADALGHLGDTRAVDPLIEALAREPDEAARTEIISSLGRLGDGRAVEPLVALIPDPALSPRVAGIIARVLGLLRDPRAVEPLLVVARNPRFGFPAAQAAVVSLGEIADVSAVDGLQRLMESHWTDGTRVAGFIGRRAAEAMRRIEAAQLARGTAETP